MRFGDIAVEKFCDLLMQYFHKSKPYEIELGESGSCYPLGQNRAVGKITAISELLISVVEDFLLFPGKKNSAELT